MADEADIDALLREATAAHDRGALAEAQTLLEAILGRDPLRRDAIKHHTVIATKLNRPEAALAVLDIALRADPTNPEWMFGRALVLADLGRRDEAIAAYDQAIAARPDELIYRQGRAGLLVTAGRIDDALTEHDAILALRPDLIDSHMARGGLLARMRRFDEALAAYDHVIEIQEDYAHAWFAKAMLLLSLGRYAEGWPLYEWRWFVPGFAGQERLFAQPMWDGTPFGDRTLYIHIEQGLGDAIQFYRFVLLAKRFGRVVLGVTERLAPLFASQPDAPIVISTGQPMPRIDLHCPIMSLPWLLGIDHDTLPAAAYLCIDPERVRTWVPRLSALPAQKRVGISWAGNERHQNDRNRSMPLRTMLAMLVPDVAVVSLQKNVPAADRESLRHATRVLDLTAGEADLADTAAVISQLDLIISVDTMIAHLAGALGKPVWVLLSADADWRWLLDREDSPWYRSARLFRQDTLGDWSGVVRQVRDALLELR